jgi:hypothetical protein
MKKVYLFLLLFITAASANFSRAENLDVAKPEFTINLSPWMISVLPNDYVNAQYVEVKTLDANNHVLATVLTTPSQTASFMRSGQERKVSCTYHFNGNNGTNFIIIDIIDIG